MAAPVSGRLRPSVSLANWSPVTKRLLKIFSCLRFPPIRMAKGNNQKPANGSALDFAAQFWAAADTMRGHMDASEYNGARPEGLCLGLIFLKYISDAFEEKREQLRFGFSDPKSEWFIKDEPQRADAAENRDFSLSASNEERTLRRTEIPRIASENLFFELGRSPPCPPGFVNRTNGSHGVTRPTLRFRAKSPEIGKV